MTEVDEGADTVRLADVSGDPYLRALTRVLWIAALHSAGQLQRARRSSAEAMTIALELGDPGLQGIVKVFHAAALDALGEHAAAAVLAEDSARLGQEAGFPDALRWYAGRMSQHWTWEGQPDVAAELAVQGVALFPRMVGYHGTLMFCLALAGRTEEFSEACERLPEVLLRIPIDALWIFSHVASAYAMGFCVHDRAAATTLYQRLLPYRHLHASYIIGYIGPVEVALGVLARILGDTESAATTRRRLDAGVASAGRRHRRRRHTRTDCEAKDGAMVRW